MNSKFVKKAASGTVSGLALGLILALTASPSLAAPHGGHGNWGRGGGGHDSGGQQGGYQGGDRGSRGGWNNDNDSTTTTTTRDSRTQSSRSVPGRTDNAAPARPAPARPAPARPAPARTATDGSRPWWGGNNHAPLNGRPAAVTNTGDARNNAPDHGYRGGDQQNRGDRGQYGGDRNQTGWNGGNDRGDRYGGGHDRGDRYGGGNDRGDRYGGGDHDRGRSHFDWHNNQHFHGYSGVRYGFYFFPGVGYYNVPSQWYGHRWMDGEYLPDFFDSYRIYDWQSYDLPAPPYGCAWYFVGEDAVMVDLDTGRIIDVIYDIY